MRSLLECSWIGCGCSLRALQLRGFMRNVCSCLYVANCTQVSVGMYVSVCADMYVLNPHRL